MDETKCSLDFNFTSSFCSLSIRFGLLSSSFTLVWNFDIGKTSIRSGSKRTEARRHNSPYGRARLINTRRHHVLLNTRSGQPHIRVTVRATQRTASRVASRPTSLAEQNTITCHNIHHGALSLRHPPATPPFPPSPHPHRRCSALHPRILPSYVHSR